MRLIGELENDQQAQLFAAYLLTHGIASQVDSGGDNKSEIWAKDEDQFQQALEELQLFKRNPTDSKYANSFQQAKLIAREEEKKRRRIQKKIVHVGASNVRRRPPLTLILIGICVVVALATDFGSPKVPPDHPVYRALEFVSVGPPDSIELATKYKADDLPLRLASLSRGQIWRTVTPIFIHFGLMHILFNLYMFFQFGNLIENRYGTLKFGLLVLATAVLSNLVQCLVPVSVGGSAPGLAAGSGVLITRLGGMSGVVYGLFGFVWMKSVYDRSFGFRISQSTVVILIVWLVLCMVPPDLLRNTIGFNMGNVANWAHGVGLAVGMAIGYASTMAKIGGLGR
jgi:GlpG protein